MNFPEALTATVKDSLTGSAVSDVAFVLRLRAPRKNDYFIGPAITNLNGEFIITRSDCESDIRRSQNMFVMDYSGDLLTCGTTAELLLHSPEAVQRMIENYDSDPEFWGMGTKEPEALFCRLRLVQNKMYLPFGVALHEDEIDKNPKIEVRLIKSHEQNLEARN